jgi:hypothetical protein
MSRLNIIRPIVSYLVFFPLFLTGLAVAPVQAQDSVNSPGAEEPAKTSPENATEPNSSSTKSESIFSLEGGKKLMAEADRAVDAQQYDVAADKLQSARQIFNQLSNFYLQLFNSFSGLDNPTAESHRLKALETGQLRDDATYQLALVHRAQNKAELSVPLLIQIIGSQSPTSGLGKKAYEQLLEIGFVDAPLPPAKSTQPGTANPQPVNPEPITPQPVTP